MNNVEGFTRIARISTKLAPVAHGKILHTLKGLFRVETQAERWLSGLKRTPGKREWVYTPPGVRIPLSPPLFRREEADVNYPEEVVIWIE